MPFDINLLLRNNIKQLVPYSSARDEFKGEAKVYLDANENAFGSPLVKWYNRYPDPMQWAIKEKLSFIKKVPTDQIFLGNGSDECIDILYRAFCRPGVDNVIITPPTYGMYEVSANINDIEVRKAPLLEDYQLDLIHLENLVDNNTKIIWLCSPNNPTGNNLRREDIEVVLNNFDGLVVVDEAYINYSRHRSFIQELKDYPNLVILQTLSKAWGLAGLRLGMAFASSEIIGVYNKVKPPYNISQATQELVIKALDEVGQINDLTRMTVQLRDELAKSLREESFVEYVFPSDANFLLVKMKEARAMYEWLLTQGIVVRDRSKVQLCENSLRITVGTPEENNALLAAMRKFIA